MGVAERNAAGRCGQMEHHMAPVNGTMAVRQITEVAIGGTRDNDISGRDTAAGQSGNHGSADEAGTASYKDPFVFPEGIILHGCSMRTQIHRDGAGEGANYIELGYSYLKQMWIWLSPRPPLTPQRG